MEVIEFNNIIRVCRDSSEVYSLTVYHVQSEMQYK